MGKASPEGRLWRGFYGRIALDALQDRIAIPQCAASIGDITYRVGQGGTRTIGTRPLTPERSTLEALREFFAGLERSVEAEGVKLPILVWGLNGKAFLRYGASRVYVSRRLGLPDIPAVLCLYDQTPPPGFTVEGSCNTPEEILAAFRYPHSIGEFRADHEMLDVHRFDI